MFNVLVDIEGNVPLRPFIMVLLISLIVLGVLGWNLHLWSIQLDLFLTSPRENTTHFGGIVAQMIEVLSDSAALVRVARQIDVFSLV